MNKRALCALVVAILIPSLASAAPVKRYSFSGKVTDVTYSLLGQRTTKHWMTGVSITQRSSTVTINFRHYDGKPSSWRLVKVKNGWGDVMEPISVTPPSDVFYYCELSGSAGATFTSSKGTLVSYFKMDCYANDGSVTSAWNAFAIKLKKY